MQRLRIQHSTTYAYTELVSLQPHRLLLRPREGHDVRIQSSRLSITPSNTVSWQRDVNGNSVAVVSFVEGTSLLSIESEVVIEHYEHAPLDFVVAEHAVTFPFQYEPEERVELMAYQIPVFSRDVAGLREWLRNYWQPGRSIETYVLLDTINRAIADGIPYAMREVAGVQSPLQTLKRNNGSCRDFATLFIESCRCLGLAARFVSGYLNAAPPEGDEAATHAWSEVYLPGAGWKGFDSTTGKVVGSDHITVAVSRHPESVPPVAGSFVGAKTTPAMEVRVQVSQI
jgi:transglutaminase-like putative cysteine protease